MNMATLDWPQLDIDEYTKFLWRMNPPRVTIDNDTSETATLVKVDSANMPGILLDVVQLLADLELSIHKAYISSDGGWFMDVFHVTDTSGNKITDKLHIDNITQSILRNHEYPGIIGVQSAAEYSVIELTGMDRPGLLSEICSLLADLHCNVVAAELWTHNKRVACVLRITDEDEATPGPITDPKKLVRIKKMLSNVLKSGARGGGGGGGARTDFITSIPHTERRLHQLMLADRDYESHPLPATGGLARLPPVPLGSIGHEAAISVENCEQKGYSVVSIECRDRKKLLFDTLCAIADLDYVVFHAIVDADGRNSYQEFYIRHRDGCTLKSEAERQRVIQCLRAAIDRRVSEGLRLELCMSDRVGLLAEVTRIFREHGLSVTRADVTTTEDKKVLDIFYVTDASGNSVEPWVINAICQEIGEAFLKVHPPTSSSFTCRPPSPTSSPSQKEAPLEAKTSFSIGNLLLGKPTQVLCNLGLIKPTQASPSCHNLRLTKSCSSCLSSVSSTKCPQRAQ